MERMTTLPLDVESLLGELDDPGSEPFEGLPDGTTMGHVHFRVADVDASVRFYRDALGLGLMAQLGPMAAFFSAGGYHHHVGANTWESRGAEPAGEGFARLHHATIVLPDDAELDRTVAAVAAAGQEPEARPDGILVRDPSGNALLLAV
jgi:catechol 2,3-dioxygenase